VPESSSDKGGSESILNEVVSKYFNNAEIQIIQRHHYNEKLGVELIRRYMSEEVSNIDSIVLKKCVFSYIITFLPLERLLWVQSLR
jgi:hypothetical protein